MLEGHGGRVQDVQAGWMNGVSGRSGNQEKATVMKPRMDEPEVVRQVQPGARLEVVRCAGAHTPLGPIIFQCSFILRQTPSPMASYLSIHSVTIVYIIQLSSCVRAECAENSKNIQFCKTFKLKSLKIATRHKIFS